VRLFLLLRFDLRDFLFLEPPLLALSNKLVVPDVFVAFIAGRALSF
jgi:hypothetical protein